MKTDFEVRELADVAGYFALPIDSAHGPSHWKRVLRNAARIAEDVVVHEAVGEVLYFSALFHDAMRVDEGQDEGHGGRGGALALSRMREWGIYHETILATVEVCSRHTEAVPWHMMDYFAGISPLTQDALQIFCDADRLDLPRVGQVPRSEFFFTDFGKRAAGRMQAHYKRGRRFSELETAIEEASE